MLRDLIKVVKNYCYGLFVFCMCLAGNNINYNEWNQKVIFFFHDAIYIYHDEKKNEFLIPLFS